MVKKFKKITSVAMSIAIAVCCSIATVNVVKGETASIYWDITVSTGGSKYTYPGQKANNSPSYIYYDTGVPNYSIGVFVHGCKTRDGKYEDKTYCSNGDLWYTVRYKTSKNLYSTIYNSYGSGSYAKLYITPSIGGQYTGTWKADTY